jgi:O-antigen/teichoic acid export membrane protein
MHTSADRWFVERAVSLADAGTYAAAGQIGALPFGVLGGLLLTFAGPILYARADRRDPSAPQWITRIAWVYAITASLGWGVMALGRDMLVHLLLGRAQWTCTPLVPIVAFGWALFHFSQVFQMGLMVMGDTRALILPNAVGGAIALLANFGLVQRYGSTGAAWSLVISSAIRIILMANANRRAWSRWRRTLVDAAPSDGALQGACDR